MREGKGREITTDATQGSRSKHSQPGLTIEPIIGPRKIQIAARVCDPKSARERAWVWGYQRRRSIWGDVRRQGGTFPCHWGDVRPTPS